MEHDMNISLRPTDTEFVDIEHRGWGERWSIQFPEAIESAAGTIRAWPTIRPNWQRESPSAWGYTWRPTTEYIQQVQALNLATPDGKPQYPRLISGAELQARISTDDQAVELSLTITNTGDQPLHRVRSDGGCFQARSDGFRDGDEVARSYISSGGRMTSMAGLPRTNSIRCMYLIDPVRTKDEFEWFWGRTEAVVDEPAMVGAVSRDGRRAVVLGYEQARDAMQNADNHHCLHSGPQFGELRPGQSVTRRGWILFGDDIHELARELGGRLVNGCTKIPTPSSSPPVGRGDRKI
jgi:hypothetical protein